MADDEPIIPTHGQVIGRAKERLVEVRPSAAPHIEDGEWSHLFDGLEGQFALERSHIAAEVKAARLPFSEGEALTDLARSEYLTPRNSAATKAIGEVELRRTVVHYAAGRAITEPDATDEAAAIALLQAIVARVNEHLLDVWTPSVGRGAHAVADVSGTLSVAISTMGDLVGKGNEAKAKVNKHVANLSVQGGVEGVYHLDADPLNVVTTTDAFYDDAGASFAANSLESQQSLLELLNAIKATYNAHAALESKAGTIRRGTQFRVDANPSAVPPVTGGVYTTIVDTYAKVGDQVVTPPLEAAVEGPGQNLPIWASGGPALTIKPTSSLFDTGAALPFGVVTLRAAGGSSGQSDPELRRAAAASWTGSWGPTEDALVAGVLRFPGVAHHRIVENPLRGNSVVYAADASWSWSQLWATAMERSLRDGWMGTGCLVKTGRVVNRLVRVEVVVALRDATYLVAPDAITEALRVACARYFDERPDWNLWSQEALRATLSRADRRRVLVCSSVKVLDQDGVVLAEPTQPAPGEDFVHWRFEDNALQVEYTGPA